MVGEINNSSALSALESKRIYSHLYPPQTLGVGASRALMEEVILTPCGKNY